MKRINLNNALKQLEELKRVQGDKDAVTQIVGEVTRLGKIRALFSYGQPNTGKQRERFFDTLSAMLNEPGINQNTVIIMDDMAVCSELYLPAEPILYHATPELLQSFITWAEKDDMETWLQEYYKLCCAVLKQGGTLPNVEALTDLMKNYNQTPLGDLVKRYQEQRWFVPYSRPAR